MEAVNRDSVASSLYTDVDYTSGWLRPEMNTYKWVALRDHGVEFSGTAKS